MHLKRLTAAWTGFFPLSMLAADLFIDMLSATCKIQNNLTWVVKHLINKTEGRTQCRELPLCAGSGEGCQWQALPSPVQCEETATRTRDLPVTGGKTLPLAPGPPFI